MFDVITRETLSQQVLRSLRQYILAHGLRPGDRLPAERELAGELGVSRATVREALKSLEAVGALTRRPKIGTVLQPVDFALLAEVAQFQLLHSPADLAELLDARRLLEVSVLPMIIRHADAARFERMELAIRLMEAEINSGGMGIEGDIAFHRALLAAANNKFLAQFGALLQQFFSQARTRLLADEAEARRSLEDHRRILQALRDGDLTRAQALMEEHLDQYSRRGVIPDPETTAALPNRIETLLPPNMPGALAEAECSGHQATDIGRNPL